MRRALSRSDPTTQLTTQITPSLGADSRLVCYPFQH